MRRWSRQRCRGRSIMGICIKDGYFTEYVTIHKAEMQHPIVYQSIPSYGESIAQLLWAMPAIGPGIGQYFSYCKKIYTHNHGSIESLIDTCYVAAHDSDYFGEAELNWTQVETICASQFTNKLLHLIWRRRVVENIVDFWHAFLWQPALLRFIRARHDDILSLHILQPIKSRLVIHIPHWGTQRALANPYHRICRRVLRHSSTDDIPA